MKLQQIVLLLISFLAGAIVYAMDWQREQDERMQRIELMDERQNAIMEMQIRINESNLQRDLQPKPPVRWDNTDVFNTERQ